MKIFLSLLILFLFFHPMRVPAQDIFSAVQKGDWKSVHGVVESDASAVRQTNFHGFTPLHFAAMKGDTAILSYLIGQGAPVNVQARNGMTPLHQAVIGGSEKAVKILMDAQADPGIGDYSVYGLKALHYACLDSRLGIVKLLVEKYGVDPNQPDLYDNSPLMIVALHGSDIRIAKYLVSKGADVNRAARHEMSVLDYAYAKSIVDRNAGNDDSGNQRLIRYLISIGGRTGSQIPKGN